MISLRVQRRIRWWDRNENGYKVAHQEDGWLSRAGDEVSIGVPSGRVVLRWDTQAVSGELIYASLTYQPVRKGLVRATRRR